MIRDVLTDSLFRRVCPDCQRPEDLKVTCRHCGSEYPLLTTLAQALRLATGMPVAIVLVLTGILIASVLLTYACFPRLHLIVRV
jgi:hypothetical protein